MNYMQWIESLMLPAPHTGRQVGNTVIKAGTVELDTIWCPPPQADGLVVLLSHGNGEILEKSEWWLDEFKSHGYGLLMYDYAGYGGSSGKASEAQLELDVEVAYNFLVKKKVSCPHRSSSWDIPWEVFLVAILPRPKLA